ncbi:MAG: DUF2088 domain-containing protein, partial [Pyramidobacter sp.]|nr:DUF2088 domain-containing protein [Pyramidobacter sp.]
RLMTPEEMSAAVGENVASRLKMYNSDANVPADFEYFGATSRFTPVLIKSGSAAARTSSSRGRSCTIFSAATAAGARPSSPAARRWNRSGTITALCAIPVPVWARRKATLSMTIRWRLSRCGRPDAVSFCSTACSMRSTVS